MSGDWMKIEISLPDKPEVWEIAQILNLDPDAVVGKLIRVWRWFDQHSTDGNAPAVTELLLKREIGVTGFTEAMETVGWFKHTKAGVTMPMFDRHNTKSAKNRALTKRRVDKHRNASNVTTALPEKRREEKSINIGDRAPWIDPDLWAEFEQHRIEIKAKLTPTATNRLLINLDKHRLLGVDPNEAIRASIENQWRGVFPERLLEKRNDRNQQNTSTRRPTVVQERDERNLRALQAASGRA